MKIKTSPCAFSPPKILLVMDQNNELQLSSSDQPTTQHPNSPLSGAELDLSSSTVFSFIIFILIFLINNFYLFYKIYFEFKFDIG